MIEECKEKDIGDVMEIATQAHEEGKINKTSEKELLTMVKDSDNYHVVIAKRDVVMVW